MPQEDFLELLKNIKGIVAIGKTKDNYFIYCLDNESKVEVDKKLKDFNINYKSIISGEFAPALLEV